ncbi:P-loop containing nucleoside triphosphate hydrolase protein, partial [Xylona heveae TC161]
MAPTDISSFATTQLALLDEELQAELAETSLLASQSTPTALQRAGVAVLNLAVDSQRTGLGGKTVIDLGLDPAVGGGDLPEHGIRTGDIVSVQEQPSGSAKKKEKTDLKKNGVDGVVVKVTASSIAVALDNEDADAPAGKLWVIKLANDITYKRMNQTMTRLERFSEPEYTNLIRVLFGQSSPTPVSAEDIAALTGGESIQFIDPSLNDSQKEAIRFAIASREIALIHGPPGTGKTHTLIELILQLLKQKLRLLVCGPSNISVDNIVERLSPHKVPMVRLGHPARLLPSVLDHSLDVLTQTSDAAEIVRDIRQEMDSKQASIRKTRNGRERKAIYGDLRELRKEFRERERRCVGNLVSESKVVLATLHGAGGFQLRNEEFDIVIIDEASQALEAQCWVPLLTAKKAILAGDHLQLPPTIKSLNSKTKKTKLDDTDLVGKATLETTLFDRLLMLYGSSIKKMLTTQYRMHEKIMQFPSDSLYESRLVAAESVKSRLLKDLPYGVDETEDTSFPVVFWDTQGGDFQEKTEDEEIGKKAGKGMNIGESKSNESEAILVKFHVKALADAGLKPEDIAVVTPYNAQLALLSQSLKESFPGIELGSVDGFQGREKEAIVVSLVRSNDKHEVGFLGEKRRLNGEHSQGEQSIQTIDNSGSCHD